MWLRKIGLIVTVVLLGAIVYWRFFPNDERQILGILNKVAKTASFGADEKMLLKMSKANNLVSLFSQNAQIIIKVDNLGSHHFNGRSEIREAVVLSRRNLNGLSIKFFDPLLEISSNRQEAELRTTVKVSVDNQSNFDIREIVMRFHKVDREWLIKQISTIDTFRL
jgi:hypothetical protein